MKFSRVFPPLLTLSLVTFVATIQRSAAVTPDHIPSAFGQGQFTFLGEVTNFSFETSANKNGNTHGRAIFDNLSADTQVVVKIDCLRVQSNEALLTGTVLHSDDADFPKSAKVIFAAIDGTLQTIPGPDAITPLFVSPFPDCETGAPPLTMFPLPGDAIHIQS